MVFRKAVSVCHSLSTYYISVFGKAVSLVLLVFRGLFLINPEGKVAHCSVNDLPVGRSVDECLRLVKAFQFVQKHGEGRLV